MSSFSLRDQGRPTRLGRSTRTVEMVLGAWLVVSAFLWPHTRAQAVSTCIVGVLVFAFALLARQMVLPTARFLNVLLAIWLAASAFILTPLERLTVINDVVIAAAIVVLALVPSRSTRAPAPAEG